MAMNAVKAYFNRNWTRQDLMNFGPILQNAHTSLKKVYRTLFCAMLTATFGSYLHLIWEGGGLFTGLFTVLSFVASLIWLYFTSPWKERKRVSILMISAFFFGTSVGIFTNFFQIDQVLVVILLLGATIVFGCFWFAAWTNSEGREIYISALFGTCTAMNLCFNVSGWELKVVVVLLLFMGYLVVYSQEILYDARNGDVNFVNCTFTVFLSLPAVVVHAARLLLGATVAQHGQN